MFPDAFTPLGQVPATANRLQRAADELRQGAGSPDAVPNLPITLAHVERALDQLADGLNLMAQAVVEWCTDEDATAHETTLPPETRALLSGLWEVADSLIDSRDAIPATREWARRMIAAAASDHPEPTANRNPSRRMVFASDPRSELATAWRRRNDGHGSPWNRQNGASNLSACTTDRGGSMSPQATHDRPPAPTTQGGARERRIVCGVDGSEHARHAALAALALADRLDARLTLMHVTPTHTVVPVDVVPVAADPKVYPYSAERAASDAEDAFNSLTPDITVANADREVRLGQPVAVLAEYAAEHDAEIIVVGSRGRGAWSSAVLGSVSAELARVAPCPVMIVPDRAAIQSRTA